MKGAGRIILVIFGVLIFLGIVVFSWYKNGYNTAIALHESVNAHWAQVENQLQRRADLIPNLVATVKGYATHEKDVFTEVTRLRSQWAQSQTRADKIKAANAMTGALSRLMLVVENYPQLKANENFLALQSQLEGTENRIAVERMRYNQAVQAFNSFRRSFFGRFFVSSAGVAKEAVYFKAEKGATAVPKVSF